MQIICKCGNNTFHDSKTDFAMCSKCHSVIRKSTSEIIEPYDFGGNCVKIKSINGVKSTLPRITTKEE